MREIKKNNLDTQILQAIREAIESGEWKAGSKIPSEAELAAFFNTSRPTVRLALQKLNTMGLLETKVGVGTFVKDFSFEDCFDSVSNLIATPEMLDDVVEFRRVIESNCIRLAVKNASDEDLNSLVNLCSEYRVLSTQNSFLDKEFLNKMAALDYSIHFKICELSGNSLFALAYAAAQATLKDYFYTNLTKRLSWYKEQQNSEGFSNSFQSHEKMASAMCDRDTEKAISIAFDIIDYKVTI